MEIRLRNELIIDGWLLTGDKAKVDEVEQQFGAVAQQLARESAEQRKVLIHWMNGPWRRSSEDFTCLYKLAPFFRPGR